jgi:GMP synthase (glutamine-hydrolysing)
MRPVLVLQPQTQDGPAHLAQVLQAWRQPWVLCAVEAGDEVPLDAGAYAGVAMLGGTMSVNDPLPWLARAEALLRSAVALGVPVLGHCLGGQMLARVLGSAVVDHPVPEIGWCHIQRHDHALAEAWLGPATELPVFQWHQQRFELPAGATWLASNAACGQQAFAIGPHLGMQFHIEVDAEKLGRWALDAPQPGDPLLQQASVQTAAQMQAGTQRWLAASQATAEHIYRRWLGLAAQAPQPAR